MLKMVDLNLAFEPELFVALLESDISGYLWET
jgi:hypothetical protein